MSDLTVIFLTANLLPKDFAEYQFDTLIKAIDGHKLLTVGRDPAQEWDILDTEPKSHLNMYRQLLAACKLVTTPYIATAEDDVLYSSDHFSFYRPPLDTVAYDMSRWSLYTWTPIYSLKQRISNCTLIAPREQYIKALEERLAKMSDDRPELISEVGRYEKNLGVSPQKIEKVYSPVPVVQLNHPDSTDEVARTQRKRLGQIKAYDIPVWGKAQDILWRYNGKSAYSRD